MIIWKVITLSNAKYYTMRQIKYFDEETEHCIDTLMNNYTINDCVNSLYHFTTVEALHSIICSNSLRLTASSFMNDRTEYIDAHIMVSDVAKEMMSIGKHENYHHILEEMCRDHDEMVENHQDDLDAENHCVNYIFSSCTNYDSVPMWNYYSDKTGICIEFDREKLTNDFTKIVESCNKKNAYKCNATSHFMCIYTKRNKSKLLKDLINICLPAISKKYAPDDMTQRSGLYVDFANVINKYAYVFKNHIFQYEKEHRTLIHFEEDCNFINSEHAKSPRIEKSFYSTDKTIRPCIYVNFNKLLPIKSIYVSPVSQNETVARGISLLLKHYKHADTKVINLNLGIRNNY